VFIVWHLSGYVYNLPLNATSTVIFMVVGLYFKFSSYRKLDGLKFLCSFLCLHSLKWSYFNTAKKINCVREKCYFHLFLHNL
jgi:hypothetical protein